MKPLYKIISLIFALIVCGSSYLSAQDQVQYNNYIANQGLLNPAYNGTRDVVSGLIVYRNQWAGLEGAPVNQAVNVHGPVANSNLGLGIVLQNEQVGFTRNFDGMLAASYKLSLNGLDKFLSFGLQLGVANFTFDSESAVTEDWTDPVFQGRTVKLGLNAGFGVYYYSDKCFLGLSVPTMFSESFDESSDDFVNQFDIKNTYMYLYGGYVADMDPVLVKPTLLMRYVYGAPLQFDIGCNVLFAKKLWVGMAYRTTSDIILLTEYIINDTFSFTYSYNYTFNALNQVAKSGSHEIGLKVDLRFNEEAGMRSIRYF